MNVNQMGNITEPEKVKELAEIANERRQGKQHIPKFLAKSEIDHDFIETFMEKKELPFTKLPDMQGEIQDAIKSKGAES